MCTKIPTRLIVVNLIVDLDFDCGAFQVANALRLMTSRCDLCAEGILFRTLCVGVGSIIQRESKLMTLQLRYIK